MTCSVKINVSITIVVSFSGFRICGYENLKRTLYIFVILTRVNI